jgi:lipoprotein-anchoring transpeptidase ErfK/SrfK
MISRRSLLGTGMAALGLAATGVRAHETEAAATTLPPEMQPQLVQIPPGYEPGTIHVDPATYSLYWTLPGDQAIRYAVGIAREGLYEAGTYTIGAKKEWPSWTPTPDMVERQPELYAQYAESGMPGGPENPLGARALYLFTEERGDTFMRIHGTNRPDTIGSMVSNGCVRLVNEHIVDLYDRVPEGSTVTLYPLTFVG